MKNATINNLDILICPICGGDVKILDDSIICQNNHKFPINDQIPLMFNDDKDVSKLSVTQKIKEFYEEHPFPSYDEKDNLSTLINKANNSIFAKQLNDELPYNIKILEVGCGTGQLTNYLGIAHRITYGTDICINSLNLANQFKNKNSATRSSFYQMNLFKPIFKENSFNVVISNGVLHHTKNPELGFKIISKLLKKDGYIVIGLYNRYGRVFTNLRRILFRLTGKAFYKLDPYLKRKDVAQDKKNIWFSDQYENPQESTHTYREVLQWFRKYGFEYVSSLPEIGDFSEINEDIKLFAKKSKGDLFSRAFTQFTLPLKKNNEGGFFIMIGKKISELTTFLLIIFSQYIHHIIDESFFIPY